MSDPIEIPECRYCGVTTHSSQEFDACASVHNPQPSTSSSSGASSYDSNRGVIVAPLDQIAERKVKDCSVTDIVTFLSHTSPHGLVVVRTLVPDPRSGADVNLFIKGSPSMGIKLAKFVLGFCQQILYGGSESENPGGPHENFK